MAYESVNPYNGNSVRTFPELTNEQLEKKIATAAACYETWKQTPFSKPITPKMRSASLPL